MLPSQSSKSGEGGKDPGQLAPVTLYYFEGYDFGSDQVVRSTRPATKEFIERFRFHAVHENSMEVDSSRVDAQGLLAGDS